MGYHRPDLVHSKREIKIEIISNYKDFLSSLEKEHKFFLSHSIRKQNFEFFNLCYSYTGDINGMKAFLGEKSFDMVYNVGINKIEEIIELEKDNITKGNYLIGAYFNSNHELLRFIIGKKEMLLTLIIDQVKNTVSNINIQACI